MKLKTIILVAILIFAGFIRIFKITSLPPSLFADEVDAGYQAEIFNQNHTDYFGNKLPVHFHSFSDWRTSLQIYSVALCQSLTHNIDFSVRFPSAVYGVLSVFVFYLITRSLIATTLFAISPWAIHYSRTGFEVSGMIFVILLGIYFWQKFLSNQNKVYLYLTALSFCLSPYFYSTAKFFLIFIPLFILLIWHQFILKFSIIKFLPVILFSCFILTPMALDTIHGKAGFRFSYISIFTEPHREQITDSLRYQDTLISHSGEIGVKTSFSSYLFHNKFQLIAQKFVANYFSAFSTNFLFISGDLNFRHGFGRHGLVYYLDSLLILIGIFSVFYSKKINRISLLFLLLLVFAPLPFALTRDSDSPHATRLILMLPSLVYFSYLGIVFTYSRLLTRFSKFLFSFFIITSYFVSFSSFWHFYNYDYPNLSANFWHTGMKEAVQATGLFSESPVIFSNNFEPFLPFFLLYHPYQLSPGSSVATHLTTINNSSFTGQVLDNQYYFGTINWDNLSSLPTNSLLVVPKTEFDGHHLETLNQIGLISKKYFSQQEFYLLKNK